MKTAALFVFCFKVGCLLAGGDKLNIKKMEIIGLKIGVLFQIQDDYLDFFGTKKVGKKIGQDVIKNKKTFLFSLILDCANKMDRKHFKELYNKQDLNAIKKINLVKKYFSKYKIKDKTLVEITNLKTSIFELIESLSISENNKKELKKYIQKLSKRTN